MSWDKSLLYGANLIPDGYYMDFKSGSYPAKRFVQKEFDGDSIKNPYWYIKNYETTPRFWDLMNYDIDGNSHPLITQKGSIDATEGSATCMVFKENVVIKSEDILGNSEEKFYYNIKASGINGDVISLAFGFCGDVDTYSSENGLNIIKSYSDLASSILPINANNYSPTDRLLPFIQVPDPTVEVVVYNVVCVSLSKVFGLGNEPDLDWCKTNINYSSLYIKEEKPMSKLVWDADSERLYETGVSNGVVYQKSSTGTYPKGVAWNGLTAVTESPSGAEATALWADNIKYLNLRSAEEFGCTIEAYTYPDEFAECDGSAEIATGVRIGQQPRKSFGFSYKTILGNDTEGEAHGYTLHMVYGCDATPSEKAYQTVNDSPNAVTFSWTVTTTPVNVTGYKPTASLTIDSTEVDAEKLAALEKILYGDADTEARLPLPDEIATLMAAG